MMMVNNDDDTPLCDLTDVNIKNQETTKHFFKLTVFGVFGVEWERVCTRGL